jgi:hypothetical protein
MSNIIGGIGNQMFQYATGRSRSIETGNKYLLDISDFKNYKLHNGFELRRVFNVMTTDADHEAIKCMLSWRSYSLVKKILRRSFFKKIHGENLVVEPHFNYWSDFKNLSGDCYLYGYWQSENYFKTAEHYIRNDFTFREPLDGLNKELAFRIVSSQSISLHVRRGDYLSNSKTKTVMETCSLTYYNNAVNYIVGHIVNPVFYIFSDDIAWAKENLNLDYDCVYVNHNRGSESYRDMQLMSLCKHQIIANSSFSWWGAWLNSNPEKIVVAPKNWFKNGMDDSDLIPKEWFRL